MVCAYPGVVVNRSVKDNLPKPYVEELLNQQMVIRVTAR